MLEIFKYISAKNKNNTTITMPKNEGEYKGITKYYSPLSKEWYNSIYTFNKNYTKLLPAVDNIIIKLIGSYFNMYNRELYKKIKIRRLSSRKRRLSSKKIWVSKAELKHTNDKVLINLFIYDRNKNFLLLKSNNILHKFLYNKIYNISNLLKGIKLSLDSKLFNYIINFYKSNNIKYMHLIKKENDNLIFMINNIKNNKIFKNFENAIKLNYIKKIMKKELYIMYYKQIILFNNLKVKNIYMLPLIKFLGKIYSKKVVFNIVRLKYYFLNSDILTQIIISKTKNKKNRILKVLSSSIKNIEVPKFNTKLIIREPTKFAGQQNYIIKKELLKIQEEEFNKDSLSNILDNFYLKSSKSDLNNSVLDTLKYKAISGIRLQASGRLTRRFTAQRAIFNFKYIGSIKDINSSYKGLSSVAIRAKLKSNVQFTKLTSKTRIGTFGIKGWISGI